MVKPGPWSQSSIFFRDQGFNIVHHELSSWGLVRDLQDKVRTVRALASLLSQYTHFLLYFTNAMVCQCVWVIESLWAKCVDWAFLFPSAFPGLLDHSAKDKGFSCHSTGKESACNVGDLGSIPGLGRSPGEGKGYALQYCGLENSMDCIVHGFVKSLTWLSDFHFQLSAPLTIP